MDSAVRKLDANAVMKSSRIIRLLTPAEVVTLVDWAAREGWNPGLDDAAAFRAADPEGFLGAFVGEEMVAGISGVAYGAEFGFVGLYICRPDARGQGHGKAVWDAALARLGNRTVGLDGVAEQQANYRSMGFVPAYRTIRFSGRAKIASVSGDSVQFLTPGLLPAILDYDRRCFPSQRSAFLEHWLRLPRRALTYVRDGVIRGYGVSRQCREGSKIGPLFADDADIAAALLAALASGLDDIHIDVPQPNGPFIDMLTSAGLRPGFETMRMYKGSPPMISQRNVFGISTLELG